VREEKSEFGKPNVEEEKKGNKSASFLAHKEKRPKLDSHARADDIPVIGEKRREAQSKKIKKKGIKIDAAGL
jgi:hypothetical protein